MLVHDKIGIAAHDISFRIIATFIMPVNFQSVCRAGWGCIADRNYLDIAGIRMGVFWNLTPLFHGNGR